ncbi:hypothetical protein [Roseobacter sp. A03A-229]
MTHQIYQAAHETFRLSKLQAKHRAEGKGGSIAKFEYFSVHRASSIRSDPGIDRFFMDPEADIAPLDQAAIMLAPIRNPAFQLRSTVAASFVVLERYVDLGIS